MAKDKNLMQPNYQDGSIVNLMSSLVCGFGGKPTPYAPLALLSPERVAEAANVVLLVIDGLGYRYLRRHGRILNRYLQGPITSVFPTSTAPAITTFLTGVAPQQHGVTGWFMYLKELATVAIILPFRPRWGAMTFAEAGIRVTDVITYPSVFDGLAARCFFIISQHLVDSPYTATLAGCAKRIGYQNLTGYFAAIGDIAQRKTEHHYLYAYWPGFDALSHQYGVSSELVKNHFYELERRFADLVDSLRGTNTLLIVTADHGFIDTTPSLLIRLETHPELADCLVMPLCGETRMAYCYVHAGKAAPFEQYVRQRLGDCCELYASEEWLDAGWFGIGEPDPKLRDRIGDYILLTKGQWAIKDTVLGEADWSDVGVHGGVSEDEMYVPLLVAHCG